MPLGKDWNFAFTMSYLSGKWNVMGVSRLVNSAFQSKYYGWNRVLQYKNMLLLRLCKNLLYCTITEWLVQWLFSILPSKVEPILVTIPIICNAPLLDPHSTYTDSTQRKSHNVNFRKNMYSFVYFLQICQTLFTSPPDAWFFGANIFEKIYYILLLILWLSLRRRWKFFGATWRDVATSRKSAPMYGRVHFTFLPAGLV